MPASSLIINTIGYAVATLVLAIIINTVIAFFKLLRKRRENLVKLKDFPGPPPHWFYGNSKDFPYGKGIYKGIEYAEKYGPAFTFHIGPFESEIIVNQPEFIQAILSTSDPKSSFYRLIRPWIGDGLLLSKGKKWARNRRLLTPAFHFDILKPYQNVFSSSTSIMIEKWRQILKENPRQSIEMFEHVSLMTLDSLMKCIFGIDDNFQKDGTRNPYIKAVYDLSELLVRRFLYFPHHSDFLYYFSYNGYKSRKAISVAHAYSNRVIEQKLKEKSSKKENTLPKKYLDFLDILLECHDSDGKGLTHQEIQDEVDTFMFEGHDTTASGLSWCLYHLALHPQYQDKCRQEILEALGDRNEVNWDDMTNLSYLTMCIKESLRIRPPVPGVARQTTKEIALPDGRKVPPNTWVTVTVNSCHHNPLVWDNPEIFDPERFTADKNAQRHPHAFVPFSAGPRNCIGQHFAMNELKTGMALILKKFKLFVDGSKPAIPLPELITRAKGGMWLKLESI